jgi:hypothetical protein
LATTLNASSSSGLITTADTSTVLQLQTNGTAALTIDASANVGIGTSSPVANTKLHVHDSVNTISRIRLTNSTTTDASGKGLGIFQSGLDTYFTNNEAGAQVFSTSATERMRIDSSGNVGIGLASTGDTLLEIYGANSATTYKNVNTGTGSSDGFYVGMAKSSGTDGYVYNRESANVIFGTANAERMRIDSSGNLLVGATSASGKLQVSGVGGGTGLYVNGFGDAIGYGAIFRLSPSAGGGVGRIMFENTSGTTVGQITISSSATAYVTSSDYRLKENIAPMTGALSVVQQLKPCTYNWKVDGSDGQGFIAHELQAVVPDCVIGEKDATEIQQYEISPAVPATYDEDGNELTPAVEAVMGEREVPSYQGIDTSFLVATLTAAIQEQQAIIQTLTDRITALESK